MSARGTRGPSLLVDTNVWVDFFIDRRNNHDAAVAFVTAARMHDVPLLSPIEATKDVYFIVASELKRMQREEAGEVTEPFARAATEAAWGCLSALRKHSTIVGADSDDVLEAMTQRANHDDYEDNLVIAAALRASASHIVSSDGLLQARSPVPCIGLEEATALANAE